MTGTESEDFDAYRITTPTGIGVTRLRGLDERSVWLGVRQVGIPLGMGAVMGLTGATFEQAFPRSAEALKKHDRLIDSMPGLSNVERMKLKSSAKFLAVVVGEETTNFAKRAETLGRGAMTTIEVIRGLFGKKS